MTAECKECAHNIWTGLACLVLFVACMYYLLYISRPQQLGVRSDRAQQQDRVGSDDAGQQDRARSGEEDRVGSDSLGVATIAVNFAQFFSVLSSRVGPIRSYLFSFVRGTVALDFTNLASGTLLCLSFEGQIVVVVGFVPLCILIMYLSTKYMNWR